MLLKKLVFQFFQNEILLWQCPLLVIFYRGLKLKIGHDIIRADKMEMMGMGITVIIETKRLILRPFLEKDAEDVLEYLREPAVNCFASMKLNSLEEAKAEMNRRAGETEYYFAITLKDTGKVIGEIGAYPEHGDMHDTSSPLDTFSPCWMLSEGRQGNGYAFEAAYAFFDYLFCRAGARRIYAYTEYDNLASQHLCEKLGMRREGIFKEFVSFVSRPDGTLLYEDTVQYAILQKEWRR